MQEFRNLSLIDSFLSVTQLCTDSAETGKPGYVFFQNQDGKNQSIRLEETLNYTTSKTHTQMPSPLLFELQTEPHGSMMYRKDCQQRGGEGLCICKGNALGFATVLETRLKFSNFTDVKNN